MKEVEKREKEQMISDDEMREIEEAVLEDEIKSDMGKK